MSEVKLREIRNIIAKYNQLLKRINDNDDNIVHNFNDLNNYWHDGNQLKLKESITLANQQRGKFIESIKKQISVYETIEKEYETIGKNVKFNLDNVDLINLKIDNVIAKLKSIINDYNSLGDISFYDRSYIINNQKEEYEKILKSFCSIKKEINSKLKQIDKIEQKISDILNSFEIEEILVNNYEKGE